MGWSRTAKPIALGSVLVGSFWVKDIPVSASTALQGHVQCIVLIILAFFLMHFTPSHD